MTDKNEQMSAYLDGETASSETLDSLLQDADVKQKWARYHLIKDMLQDERTPSVPFNFSDSVMAKLASEPTILSPSTPDVSPKTLPDTTKAKVVNLFKNVAQYGIAATVAAAMVLGVQHMNEPQQVETFSAARVPVIPGVGGGMAPVSLDSTREVAKGESEEMKQKRRLNLYLQDHKNTLKHRPMLEANQSNEKGNE